MPHSPSARKRLHVPLTPGQRAADRVAAVVGSWRFILIQNTILFAWMAYNALSGHAFDPYPFILLNLALSWQAANTGPVLQMSDNRQAQKDRARDDLEAEEVSLTLKGMDVLNTINQQQLEILHELRAQRVNSAK